MSIYKDMLAILLNHILVNNKQLQTRRTTKLYSHLKIVRKQKIEKTYCHLLLHSDLTCCHFGSGGERSVVVATCGG